MILAFGFGNLWMLGWLAAAAAPVLIHLWSRRRYVEVPWAAMQFLAEALRHQARRLQIEHWLLLTLRVAAIALAVLAVAQPYFQLPGAAPPSRSPVHRVFALDASLSMGHSLQGTSVLARAKQAIRERVEASGPADAWSLVLLTDRPQAVVGAAVFNRSQFLEELERVELTDGGADLEASLGVIESVFERARSEYPLLAQREVYFVSDLAGHTWNAALEKQAGAAAGGPLERLGRQARVSVVDVGDAQAWNLAVTSVRIDEAMALAGQQAMVQAEVRSFGAAKGSAATFELLLDGNQVHREQIRAAADQPLQLAVPVRFLTPGEHVIEARVEGDRLERDNSRWLSVRVLDQLRVLCVDGQPAAGGRAGGTDFLLLALNPFTDPARGTISPELVSEAEWAEQDLAEYDAVIFSNVPQFTSREAQRLAGYLHRGGSLIFFLGHLVRPEAYNRELLGAGGGPRVLPARLRGVAEPGNYRFDPLGYRHPLLAPFRGRERSGLNTALISRYVQLAPVSGSSSQVALGFSSGDPAIVEEKIGRGTSIVVATAASTASIDEGAELPWNALPASPVFVPLVRELMQLAVAPAAGKRNMLVGQSLFGLAAPEQALGLLLPDGERRELLTAHAGAGEEWSFMDTGVRGVYSVVDAGGPIGHYAVNVEPQESDIRRIDPRNLSSVFHRARGLSQPSSEVAAASTRRPLDAGLLIAAVCVLLAESGYAWWLGGGRR